MLSNCKVSKNNSTVALHLFDVIPLPEIIITEKLGFEPLQTIKNLKSISASQYVVYSDNES